MDNIEENIINAIKDIRSICKRPDIGSIFKYISNKIASSNYTIFHIGKVPDDLTSKGKVGNKPTKKSMASFFVVSDELCVDNEKEYETVNSESLTYKEKDIQVDLSVETTKSKDVKTTSPPDKLETFTAQMVAMKAFYMNEVSNLKNEIERLKHAAYNQENNPRLFNVFINNLFFLIIRSDVCNFADDNTFI